MFKKAKMGLYILAIVSVVAVVALVVITMNSGMIGFDDYSSSKDISGKAISGFNFVKSGDGRARTTSGLSGCLDACREGLNACMDANTVEDGVCTQRRLACDQRCIERYIDEPADDDDGGEEPEDEDFRLILS